MRCVLRARGDWADALSLNLVDEWLLQDDSGASSEAQFGRCSDVRCSQMHSYITHQIIKLLIHIEI